LLLELYWINAIDTNESWINRARIGRLSVNIDEELAIAAVKKEGSYRKPRSESVAKDLEIKCGNLSWVLMRNKSAQDRNEQCIEFYEARADVLLKCEFCWGH